MTVPAAIAANEITGLVLAGGRGARMSGIDKGLQPFNGVPLARHALLRLAPQVGQSMISANRNRSIYETFGAPVWPDELPDFAGPLAGFLSGLVHCRTPFLLTVPCDTPLFPTDLAPRLGAALAADADADIAMACAPEVDDPPGARSALRPQPAFCLLRTTVLPSLSRFMQEGGRKVGQWTASHRTVLVPFDRPGDAAEAFFNANTHAELHALENR